MGRNGGAVMAKRGGDYFRKLAARRRQTPQGIRLTRLSTIGVF